MEVSSKVDQWWASVHEEQIRRVRLLASIDTPEKKATVLAHLKNEPMAFFDDWIWTLDPRLRAPLPQRLPLLLWPKQRELVKWLLGLVEEGESGVLKKARDIGATWLVGAVAAYLWLFREDQVISFGSRNVRLVDQLNDPNAIFPKIRFLLGLLPEWMMPEGWGPAWDNLCRLVNPQTGSVIVGEGGDDMGRGGRSTVYFADEWASVPRADAVDSALSGNADCVVYLSTSKGIGTNFYRKEKSGDLPVFHIYWRDDPRKNAIWKAKKLRQMGVVAFAREYEGDDGSALDQLLIPPSWVLAAIDLDLAPGAVCTAGLDIADKGDDENVLTVRRGGLTTRLEHWSTAYPQQSAGRARLVCEEEGAERLYYDRMGIGAGVAGALDVELSFEVEGIEAGATPTAIRYEDDPKKPARERFANYGTELWWSLRLRFWRTYLHVVEGEPFPHDELISIPDHPKLISELSSRLYEITPSGKIIAEPKKRMAKRGVKSPDFADSLAFCFAPPRRIQAIDTEVGLGGVSRL